MGASTIPEDLVNLYQRFGGEAVSYHEFGSHQEVGVRWLPFEQLQPKAEPKVESKMEPVNDAVIAAVVAHPAAPVVEIAAAAVAPVETVQAAPVRAPVVVPAAVPVAQSVEVVTGGSLSGLFARLDKEPAVVGDASLRSMLSRFSN